MTFCYILKNKNISFFIYILKKLYYIFQLLVVEKPKYIKVILKLLHILDIKAKNLVL